MFVNEELLHRSIAHFTIAINGVALAAIVGIPLGLFLSRQRLLATPVIALLEGLQTVPSLAMLSILLVFVGIGNSSAIVAIFCYSILPIVRNTYTGITSVEPSLIEAGRGMGMNSLQLLIQVEIPNAIPLIISGLRVSQITAYGIVTIAVLIGGGGLGMYVYRGIQRSNMEMLLTGAIPICIMAIATDMLMNKAERRLARHNLHHR